MKVSGRKTTEGGGWGGQIVCSDERRCTRGPRVVPCPNRCGCTSTGCCGVDAQLRCLFYHPETPVLLSYGGGTGGGWSICGLGVIAMLGGVGRLSGIVEPRRAERGSGDE